MPEVTRPIGLGGRISNWAAGYAAARGDTGARACGGGGGAAASKAQRALHRGRRPPRRAPHVRRSLTHSADAAAGRPLLN